MSIRVVIFDDNPERRDALQLMIDASDNMECVGMFEDCRNVLKHIDATQPDVVLMDIDMPHVDGLAGVAEIRKVHQDIKILMQTVFEDNDKIFPALCAGANGYLLKQETPERLIMSITEVLEGGAPMTPHIATKVLRHFSTSENVSKKEDYSLTKREEDILAYLVKGYSYKMIADECFISYKTVNTHINNIYKKLQVQSATGAVSVALKEGLVK
ncbi:MAG: response regulator transcription factor [Chitinophagales bacterium]|nr:response regulator transcription factor [Chitinophagaceae bacterium]MCB9064980.1 response regulator transcription factor [Chitinophagales bacterium]